MPVYHEKYLETKTKSYEGKINRNFNNDKIPKKVLLHFSIKFVIDFISKMGKSYYPQVFLEEYK